MYGCEIKHISTGLVAFAHCTMPTLKALYIERHEQNDTFDITMEVRRLHISFIMSKLFSAQDGHMLVVVLNKKDAQKNKRSAFRNERMRATRFSTSGVAYLRMTVATGVACQQGTLTLPGTWSRPPFWTCLCSNC